MTALRRRSPQGPARRRCPLPRRASGELGQDEPARAAKLLEPCIQRYPAGDVVQQAMLKLAECRMRLKQTVEARALLARLVTNFPGTPAAIEAEARLARIPRTP